MRAENERVTAENETSPEPPRRRLDRDTAPHRLEELDAMSGDQDGSRSR